MKKKFTDMYLNDTWTGGGSGYGSDIKYVTPFLVFFSNWIGKNNITSMVDFGCGDLRVSQPLIANLPEFRYTGIDIVKDAIESHAQKWKKAQFIEQDLTQLNWDSIPDADLYYIKDVLQHWPNNYVVKFLDEFFTNKPKGKLVVLNCDLANIRKIPHHKNHSSSREGMEIGCFRPLSQNHYPLSEYSTTEIFSWDTKKAYIVGLKSS